MSPQQRWSLFILQLSLIQLLHWNWQNLWLSQGDNVQMLNMPNLSKSSLHLWEMLQNVNAKKEEEHHLNETNEAFTTKQIICLFDVLSTFCAYATSQRFNFLKFQKHMTNMFMKHMNYSIDHLMSLATQYLLWMTMKITLILKQWSNLTKTSFSNT